MFLAVRKGVLSNDFLCRRKQKEQGKEEDNEEEDFVYYEELQKSAALEEIKQRHKRDQYELPPIPEQANDKTEIDPRLATREELLDFINEFRPTEEDIDSEAFFALPPEIQYEIVQDLMIKSRQTSWARLEEMVRQSRTALDFSKQQIKQLMKRNEMTQRMLQVAGMGGGSSLKNPEVAVPARIAGERSREYILVKNENVQEGLGWKLPGVTSSAVDTKVQGKKDDDDDDDHCVPELPSKNDEQNSPQHPKEEVDKVRAAVAANPKLAALFPDMDEDEDYEEDYGDDDDDDADYVDDDDDDDDAVMDDDDEDEEGRLFLEHFAPADSGYYYGGYGAAGHSSSSYYAVQEALGKMYYGAEEQQTATPSSYYEDGQEEEYNDNNNNETRLNAEEFYNLWLSRVPDAFIYMHSFNDEYKQLIRTAIFDHDMQQLESTLRRVDKVYGKTSARNTLVLESLRFHAAFLQQVISWKQRQQKLSNAEENYETEAAESASVRSSPTPSPEVSRQYQQQRRQEAAASQVQTAPLDKSSGILVLSDDEDEILLQPDPNRTNEKLNKPVDAVQAAVSSESPVEKPSSPSHDYPTDGAPVNYLQNELQEKADASSKKADPEGVSQVQQNKLSRVQDNLQQRGAGSPSVPETNTVDSKEELQEQHSPSKGVHDDVQEGTSPVTPEIDMVDSNELLQEEPSTSNDAQNNVKEEAPSPGTPETNMVDSTEVLQDQHSTTAENEELETQEEQAEPMVIDQGYNSDEELIGDPKAEEDEYARFISDIAEKDIDSVREELYRDMKELNKQQRKEMGNTDDITQQMTEDVQEMLRLFGIPYVVSPMEAEAQCAELARLSLVEGVVTDDSDVFLFGANRIYKNMFNQQKYVECYVAQDIEREMRLDRRKLIQLAYLLGSDYTDGIPGVGPVAAMEILAEFSKPGDEEESLLAPLRRFRSWYESGRDETDFQRSFVSFFLSYPMEWLTTCSCYNVFLRKFGKVGYSNIQKLEEKTQGARVPRRFSEPIGGRCVLSSDSG